MLRVARDLIVCDDDHAFTLLFSTVTLGRCQRAFLPACQKSWSCWGRTGTQEKIASFAPRSGEEKYPFPSTTTGTVSLSSQLPRTTISPPTLLAMRLALPPERDWCSHCRL